MLRHWKDIGVLLYISISLSNFSGILSIKLSDAKYDFQTYEIFKTETIYRNNTDCTCTVPDSELTNQWGSWSTCQGQNNYFQCHKGIQYRYVVCSKHFKETDQCQQRAFRHCLHTDSCTGHWQDWIDAVDGGVCSHTCGGGVRLKVRACMKKEKSIGLYCSGANRSPFDIKRESCNTQKCPEWSDWQLLKSKCSDLQASNESKQAIYVRRCSYSGKNSDKCDKAAGLIQQTTTRSCDDIPLGAVMTSEDQDFSPNTLTWILVGVIIVLIMWLMILAHCVGKNRKKQKRILEEMHDNSNSFTNASPNSGHDIKKNNNSVASKRTTPPPVPKHAQSSKWKTPINYEEISPSKEPVLEEIMTVRPAQAAPMAPPPLHGSFEEINNIMPMYRRVSPSSGHQKRTSPHNVTHQVYDPELKETYTVMSWNSNSPIGPSYTGHRYPQPHPQPHPRERNVGVPAYHRNITVPEEYVPPPPPMEMANEFSRPLARRTRTGSMGNNTDYAYGVNPPMDKNGYLESKTLGRPMKKWRHHEDRSLEPRDYGEERYRRRKYDHHIDDDVQYEMQKGKRADSNGGHKITRGDSVGFSKLHGDAERRARNENSHSHLYAEIQDGTRF